LAGSRRIRGDREVETAGPARARLSRRRNRAPARRGSRARRPRGPRALSNRETRLLLLRPPFLSLSLLYLLASTRN
jgi:hypothetical protein